MTENANQMNDITIHQMTRMDGNKNWGGLVVETSLPADELAALQAAIKLVAAYEESLLDKLGLEDIHEESGWVTVEHIPEEGRIRTLVCYGS